MIQRLFLMAGSFLMIGLQPACSQQPSSTTAESNVQATTVEDLTLADFYAQWKDSGATLVDVRSPEEYGAGHAAQALNINFFDNDFAAQAAAKLDKNAPVYIYCASGNRSGKAKKLLAEAGFKEVYNLTGAGYQQWAAAGYPVE